MYDTSSPSLFRILSKPWLLAVVWGGLVSMGCVTQKTLQLEVRQAYDAGFEQGRSAAAMEQSSVFVFGPVQRKQIPWEPGLTLAQAIVEAVYTAPDDPQSIVVTRDGESHPVDPATLLSGVDFDLAPGDSIQIVP